MIPNTDRIAEIRARHEAGRYKPKYCICGRAYFTQADEDIHYLLDQLAEAERWNACEQDLFDHYQADSRRLAEVEGKLARLREAQRWIPVGERLPECEKGVETGPILYRMKTTGTVEVGYYGCNGKWRDNYFRHLRCSSEGVDLEEITHWMPLPAAPGEGE